MSLIIRGARGWGVGGGWGIGTECGCIVYNHVYECVDVGAAIMRVSRVLPVTVWLLLMVTLTINPNEFNDFAKLGLLFIVLSEHVQFPKHNQKRCYRSFS